MRRSLPNLEVGSVLIIFFLIGFHLALVTVARFHFYHLLSLLVPIEIEGDCAR